MSSSIETARVQLAEFNGAFHGSPSAMQAFPNVEAVPTHEALRRLQVENLHLRNALAAVVDAVESIEQRRGR